MNFRLSWNLFLGEEGEFSDIPMPNEMFDVKDSFQWLRGRKFPFTSIQKIHFTVKNRIKCGTSVLNKNTF